MIHKEEEVSGACDLRCHSGAMDERRGFRAPNMATYGTMAPPYEPNYPDSDRAPLLPALAPAVMSEVASLTNPAVIIDGPTAPPSDWANIPGYEGMSGHHGGKLLPPPPMPDVGPTPASTNWLIPSISEDDARRALLEYSNGKCCYGSSPAEEMDFQELQAFNTYRYRLETFTELRECDWVTAPFTGQPVDSAAFGVPPLPWDIPINIPALFKDGETKMPVPHTSSLKTCPQCLGTCRTVCKKCHGTGRVQCWVCHGRGRQFEKACHHCRGQGTERCTICNSCKFVKCEGCSGYGQILNFIQLTVTWKNHIYEFVADHNSDFNTELFKKVTGEKIFMDEKLLLSPLVAFPVPSINQSSQFALQQHRTEFFSTGRVLRQRHTIQLLPLTKVEYVWRENRYNYFVYGKENKVYTENYPQKCGCCVVM
ncbi:protein SSUH2 homolog isoform X1 [Ranitomeya variabilis]|uniref:protein SSUH2 homolog isoform X1 n=1 Tax=Ranitomeya variabilis TaxID=490064 RepID=UPI0040565BCD